MEGRTQLDVGFEVPEQSNGTRRHTVFAFHQPQQLVAHVRPHWQRKQPDEPESPFGRLLGRWWIPWFQPQHQHLLSVANLERELDRAASVARDEQPEVARELQMAAEQIRESKLKEKLQFSRGTIEQWDPEQATTLEMNIEADLQALRDQLEEAAGAAGERQADPLEQALEQTRDLVRSMEAMDRRLRESQAGEPGQQEGQPGGADHPEPKSRLRCAQHHQRDFLVLVGLLFHAPTIARARSRWIRLISA